MKAEYGIQMGNDNWQEEELEKIQLKKYEKEGISDAELLDICKKKSGLLKYLASELFRIRIQYRTAEAEIKDLGWFLKKHMNHADAKSLLLKWFSGGGG